MPGNWLLKVLFAAIAGASALLPPISRPLLDFVKAKHAAWMRGKWADVIARMGLTPDVPPDVPPDALSDTRPAYAAPEPGGGPAARWRIEGEQTVADPLPHSPESDARRLSGTWEGRWVRVRIAGDRVEVDIDGAGKFPSSWWIRKPLGDLNDTYRETSTTSRGDLLSSYFGNDSQRGPRDVITGDPDFDHWVSFGGEATEVLALLDPAARSDLIKQIGQTETLVRDGRIVRSIPLGRSADVATLARCLQEMANLADRLQPIGAPAERLLHNATSDPVIGVRVYNLQTLQEKLGDSAQARAASRHALVHGEPVERLQGALHLGAGGLPALAAIAQAVPLDETLRARALRAYLERAPRRQCRKLLKRILFAPPVPEQLRATAIGALVHLPVAEARPLLGAVAAQADPVAAAELARAIAAAEHPAAETILLELLARPNINVHQAAAEGLGAVGSVGAVEPLLAVEAAAASAAERQTVRQAILRIQSRLRGDGAEAGTLSLATVEPDAGTLSLAPEPGGLAIATDAAADQVAPDAPPTGAGSGA